MADPSSSSAEDWLAALPGFLRDSLVAAWDRNVALVRAQFDSTLQAEQQHLEAAIALLHESDDLEPLQTLAERTLQAQTMTPQHLATSIRALSRASDRALAAAAYVVAIPPDDLDREPGPSLVGSIGPNLRRQWPTSRRGRKGSEGVDREASAALTVASIAIAVSQATESGLNPWIGSGELDSQLHVDRELRRTAVTRGCEAIAAEPDRQGASETSSDGDRSESGDPLLALAHLGIQAAQVGEFAARRLRAVWQSNALKLLVPLPLHPVLSAVQLLTSDLALDLSSMAESSLNTVEKVRQLELAVATVSRARRLPTPTQFQAARTAVFDLSDRQLRPLLSAQLLDLAEAIDPTLRNDWLDGIGRQFNAWNPLQVMQGWVSQPWMQGWQEACDRLCHSYPELSVLNDYRDGVQAAAACDRLMDSAHTLRDTAALLTATA